MINVKLNNLIFISNSIYLRGYCEKVFWILGDC